MKCYAGIGSRNTPKDFLILMNKVAQYLTSIGYVLRSGGAKGADSAFELGCDTAKGAKEIYLPWKYFEKNKSQLIITEDESNKVYSLAKEFHGGFDNLTQGAKKLIARNTYQVLGKDLSTPSKFIVCYTKDGKGSGGTGQALRIAKKYNIPVFDMGKYNTAKEARIALYEFLSHNEV